MAKLKIVLDWREGEFGTLYVANHGVPFAEINVEVLCNMGLSSKSPEGSMGNKVSGFEALFAPHILAS